MENNENESPYKCLVNELIEGRDLTQNLQMILSNEPNFSSNETYELIVQNILTKFERSLQIVQYDSTNQLSLFQQTTIGASVSPFDGSPKSQGSNGDPKDLQDHNNDTRKSRKFVPRVTQIVQGCTNSGLEGPIEDGFNWRKYGQKDILGAKYPRSYFRCTQRKEGCLATKLVQRNEDDPAFFEVTYRGEHTCYQSTSCLNIPKHDPIETLTNPLCQQTKETMLIFQKHNIKDNNGTSYKTSSISFPSSNILDDNQSHNQHQLPHYYRNYSTNTSSCILSAPSLASINFNNHHIENGSSVLIQGCCTSTFAQEDSFDQTEIDDDDFIIEDQLF